jgi:AcrR family transcriptional regulator
MEPTRRGRWDRSLDARERKRAQRDAIVRSTAQVLAQHTERVTVTQIIRGAGVGRNTFYEHFANASDAVLAVQGDARTDIVRLLDEATLAARTPVERLRALCRALAGAMSSGRPGTRALANPSESRGPQEDVQRHLERLLSAVIVEARAAGRMSLGPDRIRMAAVGGAFERTARLVTEEPALDPREHAEVLVDVVLRVFR